MGIPMNKIVEEMPYEELCMWRCWLQEPRGDDRADYHAAEISMMIQRVASMFSKGARNYPFKTFLLDFSGKQVKDDKLSQALALQKAFRVIPKEDLKQIADEKKQVSSPKITNEYGTDDPNPNDQAQMLKRAFDIEE